MRSEGHRDLLVRLPMCYRARDLRMRDWTRYDGGLMRDEALR